MMSISSSKMPEKTINGVLESVAKIIQLMNDFNSTVETEKQKELPNNQKLFFPKTLPFVFHS